MERKKERKEDIDIEFIFECKRYPDGTVEAEVRRRREGRSVRI